MTLTDGFNTVTSSFTLTVNPNQPPSFFSAPVNQTAMVGTSSSYALPSITNPDSDSLLITALLSTSLSPLPSYISLSGTLFTFFTTNTADLGSYDITITITTPYNSVTTSFNVVIV